MVKFLSIFCDKKKLTAYQQQLKNQLSKLSHNFRTTL